MRFLTDYEQSLRDHIDNLNDHIRERNEHLVKANGYSPADPKPLEHDFHLQGRDDCDLRILSWEEIKDKFKVRKGRTTRKEPYVWVEYNTSADFRFYKESSTLTQGLTIDMLRFIKLNSGKVVQGKIRRTHSCELVVIKGQEYEFPVEMFFKDIKPHNGEVLNLVDMI